MFDARQQPVLSAWQVAAIRILSAGLVLLPFCVSAFKRIPYSEWGYVILSGLLGSFFPAFLFCIAETRLDSALVGMLNALTPICTILASSWVYKKQIPGGQTLGVCLGFAGCLLLFLANSGQSSGSFYYTGFVLLATICYGLNVNMVRHRLSHLGALNIVALAFAFLIPPSLIVLLSTGYFELPLGRVEYVKSTGAALLLGVLGTAFASVLFYRLVKMASPVFASLVTYGIPFIALGWGLYFNEIVKPLEVAALVVILAGVYLANFHNARLNWRSWKLKKPA